MSTQNLAIGADTSWIPNSYVAWTRGASEFVVNGYIPGWATNGQQEDLGIKLYDLKGALVCAYTVHIICMQPLAVLTFDESLGGSGDLTDPVRFCGATKPVLLNGSQSQHASDFYVEVRPAAGGEIVGRWLTTAERENIGMFDLQAFVPVGYFLGGHMYFVKLATGPVWNETTKLIAFSPAKPAFRIVDANGVIVDAATATEAINVCPGGFIVDASPTTCDSYYFISIQESDINWSRTYVHEWGRWFAGEAPATIDIQALIYGYPADATPAGKAFPLLGGNFAPGQPRYYRVQIATGEPAWDQVTVLVRIDDTLYCKKASTPRGRRRAS